jgi:hypothetical protein
MVLWYCGTTVLWYYLTVVLWYYGIVVLRYYGIVVLRYLLRYYRTTILGYCEILTEVYEKHFAGISRNKIASVHAIKFSKFINVIY